MVFRICGVLILILIGSSYVIGKLITLGHTAALTGLRSLGGCILPLVAERRRLVGDVGIFAVITGVGCVTTLDAGGLDRFNCISVTVSENLSLLKKNFSANGALLTVGKTVFGTGRCFAFESYLRVTESLGVVGNVRLATMTGIGSITDVYTVGLGYYRLVAMSEGFGLVIYVAVTAVDTSVSGIATVYTVGLGYYRLVAMSESRHFLLRFNNVTADRALLTLGKSAFGAGGRFCRQDFFAMVGAQILIANVTGVILISIGVTYCGYESLRFESLATHGAKLTVGKTAFRTCRSFTLYGLFVVSESLGGIGNVVVSAYGTGIGGIAAVFAIRGGHHRLIGMICQG